MGMASRENFRFTDKRLALGLLICIPWLLGDWLGIVDPHRDATAIPELLCGVAGIVCVVWAAVRKTEQSLFLLVTLVVSAMVAMMPFVCVAH